MDTQDPGGGRMPDHSSDHLVQRGLKMATPRI
jgi:hypothetical protein